MKQKKKAQLRIFETVSVLFVSFILLGMGMIFYGNQNQKSVEREIEKNVELRALNIAEQIQSMPELQCSTSNIITERCFEKVKLEKLNELQPKPDYFSAFGFSEAYVDEIYPATQQWKIHENKKDNFKSKITIQIPVTITDTAAKQNKFGILTVGAYD